MVQEPPPADSPLFGRDNVIVTPHTSFYSEESLVELQTKAAQEVVAVLTGQTPRNPVNPEALQVSDRKCKVSYKCASDSQSRCTCTYFEVCTLHFALVRIRP